jgi:hypothetical protein
MTAIRQLREQLQDFIGRMIGTRHESPALFVSQIKSNGELGNIKSLPHKGSAPIQILDPEDENFGKFIFMAGFSSVGGPDPIGGG